MDNFTIIMFYFIPWLIGISVILGVIMELFSMWLWSGMDEEKRYEWLKISKW